MVSTSVEIPATLLMFVGFQSVDKQWGKLSFTANRQMQMVTLPITINGFLSAAFSATSNALQNAFSFYNTGGNYTETFEIGVNGTVSSSQIVMCRYIIIGY